MLLFLAHRDVVYTLCCSHVQQESRVVARKPRDAACF